MDIEDTRYQFRQDHLPLCYLRWDGCWQAPVKRWVVDGIMFGPKHCAHPGCADDFLTTVMDFLCQSWTWIGERCRVCNCNNPNQKYSGMSAASATWKKICLHKPKDNLPSDFAKLLGDQAEFYPRFQLVSMRNSNTWWTKCQRLAKELFQCS